MTNPTGPRGAGIVRITISVLIPFQYSLHINLTECYCLELSYVILLGVELQLRMIKWKIEAWENWSVGTISHLSENFRNLADPRFTVNIVNMLPNLSLVNSVNKVFKKAVLTPIVHENEILKDKLLKPMWEPTFLVTLLFTISTFSGWELKIRLLLPQQLVLERMKVQWHHYLTKKSNIVLQSLQLPS